MVGRVIWKGYIRLGTVDVPVKLHTAVKEERIQFHLLHRRDRVRLRQQMVCAHEKVPVPPEEQTRGFPWEEGKYLIVDPAEIEEAEPEASRAIEVHEFVKADRIAPVFLERAYFLEPDAGGKGYVPLAVAMGELAMAGICTWTMRRRSYLGALQSRGKVLRLHTLRYADEIISSTSLAIPDILLSEKELRIGRELIMQLTVPFQPEKFADEHQRKLQALLDRKARGEKIVLLRPRRLRPTAADKLLHALEASLKKVA